MVLQCSMLGKAARLGTIHTLLHGPAMLIGRTEQSAGPAAEKCIDPSPVTYLRAHHHLPQFQHPVLSRHKVSLSLSLSRVSAHCRRTLRTQPTALCGNRRCSGSAHRKNYLAEEIHRETSILRGTSLPTSFRFLHQSSRPHAY